MHSYFGGGETAPFRAGRVHKRLRHTADTRFLVEGTNMKELFLAGLDALNEAMAIGQKEKNGDLKIVRKIKITSVGPTELLIDFLSEVLRISHTEKTIFPKAEFEDLRKKKLTASLYGKKVEKFGEDVKAITYHEAEIKKNQKGNLETNLVFDI